MLFGFDTEATLSCNSQNRSKKAGDYPLFEQPTSHTNVHFKQGSAELAVPTLPYFFPYPNYGRTDSTDFS
jgi:hypothetical protein